MAEQSKANLIIVGTFAQVSAVCILEYAQRLQPYAYPDALPGSTTAHFYNAIKALELAQASLQRVQYMCEDLLGDDGAGDMDLRIEEDTD